MLKLFQYGACRRSLYLALLVLLIGFDIAKGPIQDYLAATADQARQQIYGYDGPKMRDLHETMISDVRTGTGQMSGVPRDERLSPERVEAHVGNMVATALQMEAKRAVVGSAHIGALVVLGMIGLVALIWMVFARVRHIGWPVWVGFAVLAPALLLRLYGAEMTDQVYYGIQYGFFALLVALGFVPGDFGRAPAIAASPRNPVAPKVRTPGQFGKRT